MRYRTANKSLVIANALGFNAAWWACVLGVKYAIPWLGPLMMAGFLFFHFRFLGYGSKEGLFIVFVALAGTGVDSIKSSLGFISYDSGWPGAIWLAPLWITAMWAGFAALINHSLNWLKGRYLLAFILGAVFGPPSYMAGVRFGVLHFNLPTMTTVLVLAAVWGTAVLAIVWLSQKMMIGANHAE